MDVILRESKDLAKDKIAREILRFSQDDSVLKMTNSKKSAANIIIFSDTL